VVSARPYDPFAPHSPAFPRARLLRAGVAPELVDNLAGQYGELGYDEQVAFARSVTRSPDDVIAERFTAAAATDLDELTVPELKALLSAKSLPVSGTKPELIGRLNEAGVTTPPVEAPPIAPITPVEQPAGETPQPPSPPDGQPPSPQPSAAEQPAVDAAPSPPADATPATAGDAAPAAAPEAAQPPAEAPAAAPAPDAPADAAPSAPAPADAAPAADAPAPTTPPAAGDGTTPTTGA
jgi:hypothetical protein